MDETKINNTNNGSDNGTIPTLESPIQSDWLTTDYETNLASLNREIGHHSPDLSPIEMSLEQIVDLFLKDNYGLLYSKLGEWGMHVKNMFFSIRRFSHSKMMELYNVTLSYHLIILRLLKHIQVLNGVIALSHEDAKMDLMEYKSKELALSKSIVYTDYNGLSCTIGNLSRDRVYRYKRMHCGLSVSNAEMAQMIEYDLGIPKGTAENCLSDIGIFYSTSSDYKWLSSQYVHETDHYLKSTAWGRCNLLNLKYADTVPNPAQLYQYGIELNIIRPK